jgi:hypothetical protein
VDYNLLDESWIPVLWIDGSSTRVGIIEALTQAGRIRQIALASPLDLFAVHRFILTLLYWKAALAGGVEQVRKSLLKDGEVPSAVLEGITKEKHCFDLFDEKLPFLQDPSVNGAKDDERKSAGSLFAELATGTNIAHFHHGDDENTRLCLPCVALGMLRVVPWTQSGGAGLTPSIHNAPPIMAIATGDNLGITLGLNLVLLDVEAGEPKWSGHFKPTNPTKAIPYLEALTWNPRRIYLSSPRIGVCWYCGSSDAPTVGKIVYKKNEETIGNQQKKKRIPFTWRDPAAFYPENEFASANSTQEDQATENKDLARLIPVESGPLKSAVAVKNESHHGWRLVVPTTNPKNNKTFDHRQLELPNLSPETIGALIRANKRPPGRSEGLDGWNLPNPRHPLGIRLFVQAAIKLLTDADWAALSTAAYRDMHDSPAAFDVFAGLYWGLRDKKIGRLPSRNVAWLILKLMAAVPAQARVLHPGARFSPMEDPNALPKRQPKERGRTSLYPVSFPRGERLEAALRRALDSNVRKRKPEPVDWTGLCNGLDQLLD